MPIPLSGIVNKYDPLDPACYNPASPGNLLDTVGYCNILLYGSLVYDPTLGSLTSNNQNDVGYSPQTVYPNIVCTNGWSASKWIKAATTSGYTPIFSFGSAGGSGQGTGAYFFLYNGTDIHWSTVDVVGGNQPFVWQANTWYNVTITYSSSGNLKFYVNGNLINTVSAGIRNFTQQVPTIAQNVYSGFFSAPGYTGWQVDYEMGPYLIYNVELNATQVQAITDAYSNRFFTSLHAYDAANPASYPGSGTTLSDIGSGTSIPLTINNATFDNVNDSFKLSGSLSSSIRSAEGLATQIGIGTNNFSYQLWFQYNGNVNLNGPNDIQLQVGSRGAGTYGGCNITTNSGQIIIESPGVGQLSTGFYPSSGQWYLLSLTVNSGNLNTLYVDGISVYSGFQSYGALNSLASISLGPAITSLGDTNKSGFGPLQIYDREISTTEITNYYNSTYARFTPAIHAYDAADPASYPGSGTTLTDIGTASPINLTINNATFDNINDSFALAGTNISYIRSAYPVNIGIGGNDFSVQYWFKYNGLTGQPPYNIYLQVGERGSGFFSGFNHNTYNGEVIVQKPGVGDYNTGWFPTIGTWYQVTMTVDASNNMIFYVDGVNTYSTTTSFTAPGNIVSTISIGTPAITVGDCVANVDFGPLFIYDRVLSSTEVINYYNSTVSRFFPTPPGPAGSVGGRTFGQGFAG